MKTYQFVVTAANSTVIEVEADNIESAIEIAQNQAYNDDIVKTLCNISDMQIDIDLL
jgi:hypothetical protein